MKYINDAQKRIGDLAGRRLVAVALFAVCFLACSSAPGWSNNEFEEEIRLGREAAEQVARDSKFIEDPEVAGRIERIGRAIAEVANTKEVQAGYGRSTVAEFDYSFKVIDDDDINAFALPGGFVYVNKGLIDYMQSDDELAGVIAHEVAHVAHHHAMQLIKAQQKQMLGVIGAVLLGSALGASGADVGNLFHIGSLITMAKMSSYGQKAEFDADRTAVAYLAETEYNPVGMLTAMERLARDAARKPQINYGIFATHPPAHLRAREIIREIERLGVPINRRLVTTYMRVHVQPVEDSQACAVWIADTEIIRLADADGEKAAARAERVAEKLSTLLLAGARLHDVKVGGGTQYVVVMERVVISPTAEDAKLAGMSVAELTESAAKAIRTALFKELLEQKY